MNLVFYFKNALRKGKILSITFMIRLVSAVVGVLSISIILTYIHSEFTTYKFLNNVDELYVPIYKQYVESNWRGGAGINEEVLNQVPEIEAATYVQEYSGSDVNIKYGEHSWTSSGFVVDQEFFKVFDFDLIVGNKENIFDDPNSVIISKTLATQIFGYSDPIGKPLNIQTESLGAYTIRGIYELPENGSLDFNFVLLDNPSDGGGKIGVNFVRLSVPKSPEIITKTIRAMTNRHKDSDKKEYYYDLVPLEDLHFDSRNIQLYRVISGKGNLQNIYILAAICFIIGVVVILNCSGLKFSEDFDQRKNLALKKICGATRRHRILQFIINLLFEFIIVSGIAFVSFLLLENSILRLFGFSIDQPDLLLGIILLSAFSILLIAYLFTGSLIQRINQHDLSIKESLLNNKLFKRSWITAIQFGFTIFLIISSIVVNKQYQFMLNKDLGFETENVLRTSLVKEMPWFETREEGLAYYEKWKSNIQLLKNELESNPNILSYTNGSLLTPYLMDYKRAGTEEEFEKGNTLIVTPGYINTLGLKLKEGRFFDSERDASRGNTIVINEAAKERYGINDFNEEKLENASWGSKNIVGILEDFHYEHLAKKVEPLVMYYFDDPENDYLIKINEGKEQEVIQFLSDINDKINPGSTFTYSFLEDDIKELYEKEEQLGYIYLLFTIIICLISAMGLFAFAYHSIQHRVKEIGIRKVNGARVSEVLILLNKDIIKWVTISFLVAAPLAWYFMDQWLKDFAFRITLDWWVFTSAGLFTLVIALLTISYLTWKAATRNPVEALRYE